MTSFFCGYQGKYRGWSFVNNMSMMIFYSRRASNSVENRLDDTPSLKHYADDLLLHVGTNPRF